MILNWNCVEVNGCLRREKNVNYLSHVLGGEPQKLRLASLNRKGVYWKDNGARTDRKAAEPDLENGPEPREAQELRIALG